MTSGNLLIILGHVLKNHVFSLYHVTSRLDCGLRCLQQNKCLSYNYKTTSGTCELNDANRITCSFCFVREPESTYYEDIKVQLILCTCTA